MSPCPRAHQERGCPRQLRSRRARPCGCSALLPAAGARSQGVQPWPRMSPPPTVWQGVRRQRRGHGRAGAARFRVHGPAWERARCGVEGAGAADGRTPLREQRARPHKGRSQPSPGRWLGLGRPEAKRACGGHQQGGREKGRRGGAPGQLGGHVACQRAGPSLQAAPFHSQVHAFRQPRLETEHQNRWVARSRRILSLLAGPAEPVSQQRFPWCELTVAARRAAGAKRCLRGGDMRPPTAGK